MSCEIKLKPNVIIIVTDDQGYGDIHVNGNPWLHTKLFAVLRGMEKKEIEKQCIYMLYLEGIMLKNMGASMWSVFGKNVSFPKSWRD